MFRNRHHLPLWLALLAISCDSSDTTYQTPADDRTLPSPPAPLEESCELGQIRACGDGEGTQFCDSFPEGPRWGECLVDFACMPGDIRDCPIDFVTCELDEGVPYWPECGFTPLVLSFDPGATIELSASTAAFDIAGIGECVDSDWPSAATPWLVADLDRNGFIDAGHELFGSGTILGSGRHAANGFIALEPFDGNHDGRITNEDPRFEELLIWRDEDADKFSLPFELSSLSEAGVQVIELGHAIDERCDARGNCGRERSRFEYVGASGAVAVGEVVDVHLACP